MMLKILLFMTFTSLLDARCLEGCLKCSEDNVCLYCNVQNGYQLRLGQCVKPDIPNCVLTNDYSLCLKCESGYYLDSTLNQCLELLSEAIVSNCDLYEYPGYCSVCSQGYYLKNGACYKISSPISNCEVENEWGICEKCQVGYIRSIDKKLCTQKSTIIGCGTQKHVTCRSCADGYLKNENYYLNLLYNFQTTRDLDLLTDMRYNYKNSIIDSHKFPVCQPIEISNCSIYRTATTCAQCNTGYFVNNKQLCEINPTAVVDNCLKYSSLTNCVECYQGFRLNSGSCVEVYEIENCQKYRADVELTVCVNCHKDYYLEGANLCTKRTELSMIELCEDLSDTLEKCIKCLDGYIPTTDGYKCLAEVENCERYVESNRNTTIMTCQICEKGFFYDSENRKCIKGTVQFCEIYEIEDNQCEFCQEKFYLVENQCHPQKQLTYCQKYSPFESNTCVDCDDDNFLFQQTNQCVQMNTIPHCVEYKNKTSCEKCEAGYQLRNGSECIQIPMSENCLEKEDDDCVKCLPNFALLEGQCVKGFDWVRSGCSVNNLDGETDLEDLECIQCKKNFVPINVKDTYLCYEKSTINQMINFNKAQNFDEDCMQYSMDFNNNTFQCSRCVEGRVLVNGKCRENCTQPDKRTLYKQWITLHNVTGEPSLDSIKIEFTNICETTIPNCAVASVDVSLDFNLVRYACEKCMDGYLPLIDIQKYGQVTKNSEYEKEIRLNMPRSSGPGLNCVEPDQNKMVGKLNEFNFIDDCEYYFGLSKDLYGCRKCLHGATGVVIQQIENCTVYQSWNQCIECDAGYYMVSSSECRPILAILNCIEYDGRANTVTCTECKPQFYLDTNQCVKREVSQLLINCDLVLNADSCDCHDGYVQDPITLDCLEIPENCVNTTVSNSIVSCTSCDDEVAYRNGTSCVVGTVSNCAQFHATQDVCLQCENGFYLQNDICNAQNTAQDTNCQDWNLTNLDVCDTCSLNTTKFQIYNYCKSVPETIDHCDEYADLYSCAVCDDGYFLNNLSKRCLPIPEDSNCLEMSVVDLSDATTLDINDYTEKLRYLYTCDKCKVNYYRRQYSIDENYLLVNQDTADFVLYECVDWLSYATSNCSETDIDGYENLGQFCYGCDAQYIPLSLKEKYVCVNTDYLVAKKHGFDFDANCQAYKYDINRNMMCTQCIYPFFLDNGECVDKASCSQGVPHILYISSNKKVYKNVCVIADNPITTDCEIYVSGIEEDYTGATTVYTQMTGCYSCDVSNSLYPAIYNSGIDKVAYTIINPYDLDDSFKVFNQNYPLMTCYDNGTNAYTLIGIPNSDGDQIPNCAAYKSNSATFGCTRCKTGYHGRLRQDADGVYIEYCELMATCSNSVLSGLEVNVEFTKANEHLFNYFSCFKCNSNTEIPVAFISLTTSTLVTDSDFFKLFTSDYDLQNTQDTLDGVAMTNDNQPGNSFQIQCWDETKIYTSTPTDTGYVALVNVITQASIANCALGLVDIEATDDQFYCVACKSGYYPTFNGVTTWLIDSCTAYSSSCGVGEESSNLSFNTCDSCINTIDQITGEITYVEDAGNDPCLDYVGTTHCLAGYDDGGIICVICEQGYELDSDNNVCNKIEIPGCVNGQNNFSDFYNENFRVIYSRFIYMGSLYYSNLLGGCKQCSQDDDVLYYVDNSLDEYINDYFCAHPIDKDGAFSATYSTYLKSSTDLASITNCDRYGYKDGSYICVECSASFTLLLDTYRCEAQTTNLTDLHGNCAKTLQSTSVECEECETGFIKIGGLCRQNDADYLDDNCATIADGQATTYQSICAICDNGFYAQQTISPFNRCVAIPNFATSHCIDYLDNTGCVTCEPGYGLMIVKEINSTDTKRICVDLDADNNGKYDHDPNCTELNVVSANDSFNQQRLICNQCSSGSVLTNLSSGYQQKCYPVVNTHANCIEIDKPSEALDITASQLAIVETKDFRCLNCVDIDTHYLNLITDACVARTVIANCENYDKYSDHCKECQEGYYLNVNRDECQSYKTNRNWGYLDTCREVEGCLSSVWYEGLNADYNQIYSCHKCEETDYIPFVIGVLELDENINGFEYFRGMKEFDSNFIPYRTTNIVGQPMVQCLDPVNTTFNVLLANFNFPSNCGLGFVNLKNLIEETAPNTYNSHDATQSTGNAALDYNKTTIRCSACLPGYAPTKQEYTINTTTQELGFMVKTCTAITNCESSTWFNACSQCSAGYAYSYDNEVDFGTCVAVPAIQKGCWSYDSTTARCKLCKKGAYLNKDYICEEINPPNCEAKNFRFNETFTAENIYQGLYFTDGFVGCNRCEEGYVGILQQTDKSICVESQYHITGTFATNTFYITNCLSYSLQKDILICNECRSGYALDLNQTACYVKTQLSNCIRASSTTLCDVCDEGYVLVNRSCQSSTISNCLVFGNNEEMNKCDFCGKHSQVCIQCEPGYYLQGNQCIEGVVKNCKVNETSNICQECIDGYTLVLASEGTSYCYPNDNRFFCDRFNPVKFQAQILECEECIDDSFVLSLSETDRARTTCMPFVFVERCLEYNNNPISFGNSDFQCVKCEENSYLYDGSCVYRTVIPDECIEFTDDADTCEECEDGFFINATNTACTAYPQGIFACQIYQNKNTCSKCNTNYYLKDEICNEVEITVDNCVDYEDDGVCFNCDTGYLAINGECFAVLATGCQTYKNIYACESCASTETLQEVDGIISCTAITITNCLQVDDVPPYDCLKCDGEFYPNGQECTAITAAITNCTEYDSATTCSLCEPSAILEADGSACYILPESLSHIDSNCTDNLLHESPICDTCKPGYLFVYGTCNPCPENMINQGCYTCDPIDTSKCLMCSQGWIQTPEGNCRKKLIDSIGVDDMGRSLRSIDLDDHLNRR